MSLTKLLSFLLISLAFISSSHAAESVVRIGGGNALLNVPGGKPKVGLVLFTGGSGYIGIHDDGSLDRQVNWIVRTRAAYVGRGIASLLVDGGVDANQAIAYMRQITPKVVVVAMSRGSLKIAESLNSSPNGIVLASSMLERVEGMVGDPARMPATLVVHHRQDMCHATPADDVEDYIKWASGRARVVWVDGGTSEGDLCEARAYHGFIGRESVVTGAIASFALGVH